MLYTSTPKILQLICALGQAGECNKRCPQSAWKISTVTAVLQTRKWKLGKVSSKAMRMRAMIFTCQLCPEHWAVQVFSMDEREDAWFRVKTCGFLTKIKKKKKGQNYSSLAAIWGGYLEHLRLVDEDLR